MHLLMDPLWQAPTLGSILIGVICAMMSVFITLRKESLIGEVLAHASYPGLSAAIFLGFSFSISDVNYFILMVGGGFISCIFALLTLNFLQRKMQISADSSLCFVLSFFFGLGLLIASSLQLRFGSLYHLMQEFLFGSAATLTLVHLKWQLGIGIFLAIYLWYLYSSLKITTFDPFFAQSLGIKTQFIDRSLLLLTALCVTIGIPSVGIVLISGLIVTPTIAAKQFTDKLPIVFLIAICIGGFCGFLGNYLSYVIAKQELLNASLPTGPVILLASSFLCILSLLFAPKRGILFRFFRKWHFQMQCRLEHVLKTIWRFGQSASKKQISERHRFSFLLLLILKMQGWVKFDKQQVHLTSDGKKQSAKLVRLHRLWEVYLTQCLDISDSRVHQNADTIEHILSGELEEMLERILGNKTIDPHQSVIPAKEITW